MYGRIVLDRAGKGWRTRLEEERVKGMPLAAVRVPAPEGLTQTRLKRRVHRAGERLWEQGVTRVLAAEDLPPALWEQLERTGLAPMDVEALCREAAEPLVLALLERRGVDPAKATVCLTGSCALGAVQNAAEALARHVGRLVIDCPGRGSVLALWLHQTYGLPLMEPGAAAPDVTAAFAPERGEGADLKLYGPAPDLGGLRLGLAEDALPDGLAPLPLLAALRESGCVRRDEVRVLASDRTEGGADAVRAM